MTFIRSSSGVLSYPTPQAFAAADLSGIPDMARIYIGTVNDQYIYRSNLSSPPTSDGLNIITPAAPSTGRALRQYVRNIVAQAQTAWEIDPVSGDDRNSGLPGFPLKSLVEWSNRMHNAEVMQDVTVTLRSGTLTDMGPSDIRIATGVLVTFQGTVTSTAPSSFTAVTNTNSFGNVRGTITDPSGSFARGQRLRTISGTHSGAITYCQGTTTSTVACVAQWSLLTSFHPPSNGASNDSSVSIGDNYVIDTLQTTFRGRMDLRIHGAGRILWKDINFTSDPTNSFASYQAWRVQSDPTNGAGIMFVSCSFDANCFPAFTTGLISISQCIFLSSLSLFACGVATISNCIFQSFLTIFGVSLMQLRVSNTIDGGRILQTDGGIIENQGPIECGATSGAGGVAWEVDPSCFTYQHSNASFWGPTSGYTYGVRTYSTSGYQYKFVPTLTGSLTADAIIAGVNKSWAQLPFENTTNMSAAVPIP
jgi:hypothetical protein